VLDERAEETWIYVPDLLIALKGDDRFRHGNSPCSLLSMRLDNRVSLTWNPFRFGWDMIQSCLE
jgi:hypothetical protein